jgi:CRP-like cAMP-binding protein
MTNRSPDPINPPLPAELATLLPPALHGAGQGLQYPRGERLFTAGEGPAWMFYVLGGEVVLQRPGLNGEVVVLQRTRHGFVGEASLQSAAYHCDGLVTAHARMVRWPVAALREALATDPAFAGRWIAMLNRELRRLRLQCERLALPRVQDRVLHLLETEGVDGRLAVPAGLKSLAGELGVTHEALYRAVAALEKTGRLVRDGGALRRVGR